MKKKEKKEIPISNYIKLFLLIVLTVIITLIVRIKYIESVDYENDIPVIGDTLVNEINSNEIYNYIRENNDALIYIGVANNSNCRKLEKRLKSFIEKNNLEEEITYLNITGESKKNSFIKEFNKFYGTKVLGYPSFIAFEDGKVKEILTTETGDELEFSSVKSFLNKNTYD